MKKIKFLIATISFSIISIVGASVAVFSNVTNNTISFFRGARANLDHVLSINCEGYNQGTVANFSNASNTYRGHICDHTDEISISRSSDYYQSDWSGYVY